MHSGFFIDKSWQWPWQDEEFIWEFYNQSKKFNFYNQEGYQFELAELALILKRSSYGLITCLKPGTFS